MSEKDWLQDLFIEEAKPALDRHSGGGGGGSSDLIDCEEFPTEGVKENAIYRKQWVEETFIEPTYTVYVNQGGEILDVTELVVVVDSLDGLSDDVWYLYTGDGKVYMISDGTVTDFAVINDVSLDSQLGFINSTDAFSPDAELQTGCVKTGGEWLTIRHKHIGFISGSEKLGIYDYSNDGWYKVNRVRDLMSVRGCENLFFECRVTSLDEFIGYHDTSEVTNMRRMFYGCYDLTSVPLFDTSSVTNMSEMFYQCESLTSVPLFDTSSVTNMDYMFCFCYDLTSVPLFDTSSVTFMSYMFNDCEALTSVPLFDTSSVTNMESMFYGCRSLTSVPLFNTSSVTVMRNMFYGCYDLTSVPLFDTSSVTSMGYMFYSCRSLTDCYLRNIKVNLQVGSGSTYGHLLTVDSLVHLVKELVNVGLSRTLTIGSVNLTKIESVYVKQIEITDEMRAADDLIDSKLACEVCESTDEGAMTLQEFATLKQWALK